MLTYSSTTGIKLSHVSEDGTTEWSNQYGDWPAEHTDRVVLPDGRVAVLAFEGSNDQGILEQFDFRLLLIEPGGSLSADHRMRLDVLWDDFFLDIEHLVITNGPDGQLVALIEVGDNLARRLLVTRFSTDGVVSWARWYGDVALTGETPIWTEINDHCHVVCGDQAIYVAFVNLSGGFHVMKLSDLGDVQWCVRYEYENTVLTRKLTGLHITLDGSMVGIGWVNTQIGRHGLLLRLGPDGSLNAPRLLLANGENNNEITRSSMAPDGTLVCRLGLPSTNRFVHLNTAAEVVSAFRTIEVTAGNNAYLLQPKRLEWDGAQLFVSADLKRTHQIFGYVDLFGSFWRMPVPLTDGCAFEASECGSVVIPDTLFTISSVIPEYVEEATIQTSTTVTPVQEFSPAGITDQCEALATSIASFERTDNELVISPSLVATGGPVRVDTPVPCFLVVLDAQGRTILRTTGSSSSVTALTAPSIPGSYMVMACDSSGYPLGIGRMMVQ